MNLHNGDAERRGEVARLQLIHSAKDSLDHLCLSAMPALQPEHVLPSSASASVDRYLSRIRVYHGSFGEILMALHDQLASSAAHNRVTELLQSFDDRASRNLSRLERPTLNMEVASLLEYQLNWDLLSVLREPIPAHEQRADGEVRMISNLANVLEQHSRHALCERCVPQLRIRELSGGSIPPAEQELCAIEEINRKLVINPLRDEPQSGFGRVVERPELRQMLSTSDARLFLMELSGEPIGYYIVDDSLSGVTRERQALVDRLTLNMNAHAQHRGWAEIVGILPEGRKRIEASGFKAYDLLDTAVLQSARAHGVELLFGEVREGTQANLAKQSHQRCGWRESGMLCKEGNFPYQLIWRPTNLPKTPFLPRR